MELAREIISSIFIGLGCFLALTGAVGIVRMPDFFTRVHPAGKTDTLAQTLVLIGFLIFPGSVDYDDLTVPFKLIIITILLYLTAPSSTHAITQAAHLAGLRPWSRDEGAPATTLDGSEDWGREDWDHYPDPNSDPTRESTDTDPTREEAQP